MLHQVEPELSACPGCGHVFATPSDSERNSGGLAADSVVGLSISAVIHIVFLAILATVSWVYLEDSGHGPDTTEVGLVHDDQTGDIEAGAAPGSPEAYVSTAPPQVNVSDARVQPVVENVSIDMPTEATSSIVTEVKTVDEVVQTGGNAGPASAGIGRMLGGSGTAGGGSTRFFGTTARGHCVFVIDCSGSMGNGPGSGFHDCVDELERALKKMNASSKFSVVFFNNTDSVWPDGTELVRASRKNRSKAMEWARKFRGGGGTRPASAMDKALSMKPKVIFFLTDGGFNGEPVLAVINKKNRPTRIVINTISFRHDGGKAILQKIAEENRGVYRHVANP